MRHGGRWVLVGIEGVPQGRVTFHASDDLHTWEELSEYTNAEAMPTVWECPDLLQVPIEGADEKVWVLKVNTTGGHETFYVVGKFDGATFHDTQEPLLCNHGCAYAEQAYILQPGDERCLLVAWIRQAPREERPWTGMMSIPRELRLRRMPEGLRLIQRPARELDALHEAACWHMVDRPVDTEGFFLPGVSGGALDLALEIDARDADEIFLSFDTGNGQAVLGCKADSLYFQEPGAEKVTAPLPASDGPLQLRVVLDRGVVEAFAQDGLATLACLFEPPERFRSLALRSKGGTAHLIQADAWPLPDCMER
jgi:sucrose-6-phosphate hydrolase SacC (GH32 family)